jgi:hypothetical protein
MLTRRLTTRFRKDAETASSAVRNLNGYELGGRQLRVDYADMDPAIEAQRQRERAHDVCICSNSYIQRNVVAKLFLERTEGCQTNHQDQRLLRCSNQICPMSVLHQIPDQLLTKYLER